MVTQGTQQDHALGSARSVKVLLITQGAQQDQLKCLAASNRELSRISQMDFSMINNREFSKITQII